MEVFTRWFNEGQEGDTWHNYWFEVLGLSVLVVTTLLLLTGSWFAFVLFAIAAFCHSRFRQVKNPQRVVIEFLGKPVAVWGPGPHFLYPGLSERKTWLYNAVQEIKIHVDAKEGHYMDGDGVTPIDIDSFGELDFLDDTSGVDMTLMYRITSPILATYAVGSLVKLMIVRVENYTRSVLTSLQLDEALHIKEGAAKLIMSYFLKPDSEHHDQWEAIRALQAYKNEDGRRVWIDHEMEAQDGNMNRFLEARRKALPHCGVCHTDYVLDEWGVQLAEEGVVISDFNLSEDTITARRELLKQKRAVEAAAFERRVSQLKGLGEKERLEAIVASGIAPSEAAAYSTAIRLMESGTLRDKTLLLAPGDGGLDFTKLAAIMGVAATKGAQAASEEKSQ